MIINISSLIVISFSFRNKYINVVERCRNWAIRLLWPNCTTTSTTDPSSRTETPLPSPIEQPQIRNTRWTIIFFKIIQKDWPQLGGERASHPHYKTLRSVPNMLDNQIEDKERIRSQGLLYHKNYPQLKKWCFLRLTQVNHLSMVL